MKNQFLVQSGISRLGKGQFSLIMTLGLFLGLSFPSKAQENNNVSVPDIPNQDVLPFKSLSREQQPLLPPLEDYLNVPNSNGQVQPTPGSNIPETIVVDEFIFGNSTVFSPEDLQAFTKDVTGTPVTIAELLAVTSKITQEYNKQGYITSGAYIPANETFDDGVVTIEIVEGKLEEVNLTGVDGVHPDYIKKRIQGKKGKPLNVNNLVASLQLLQLDPLVNSLSTQLRSGSQLGNSILDVEVNPANTFSLVTKLDNDRSPSVGSFRRGVQISDGSLLGQGDRVRLGYFNTKGSDEISFNYGIPLNRNNGTISFDFSNSWNDVVEEPANELDIQSEYRIFGLNFRQPLVRSPQQEFALGLILDRQFSQTKLGGDGFAFSNGAEDDGKTHVTALRFYQEWLRRGQSQVMGLRSQLNLGLDLFGATINDDENIPDGTFFSWQGQAQFARQLARDTIFLFNINTQLADSSLLPIEQIGIGGANSVRGYRQGLLLTDNGVIASAEIQIPIIRIRSWDSVIQLAPFFDYGVAWNGGIDTDPDPNNLASVGVGLIWNISDRFSARFEYGAALTDVDNRGDSLQEDGFLFRITNRPF
ncbi:MAG: ShlB/FhaC/HecB family hemolysin secretion/activation protein [Xenococcaceae cyanobacterium MO_167.B27]|nr:ShlB/FhaC/HecB family hemolysin secretion/activation protein [Xenococcaceae cyanobacterium MO_167.B27]